MPAAELGRLAPAVGRWIYAALIRLTAFGTWTKECRSISRVFGLRKSRQHPRRMRLASMILDLNRDLLELLVRLAADGAGYRLNLPVWPHRLHYRVLASAEAGRAVLGGIVVHGSLPFACHHWRANRTPRPIDFSHNAPD